MNFDDILGFHKPKPPKGKDPKFIEYWMTIPFIQYSANVPIVNRYHPTWLCYPWIQEGIQTLLSLSDGFKTKVSEEAFATAVRETVRSVEETYT